MRYDAAAMRFVEAFPIGSTVGPRQLIGFANDHQNGLASDLLIADDKKKAGAIRRHLNAGGASYDLDEDSRFQLIVADTKTGQMLVTSYVDFVQERANLAVQKAVQGAMNPLKQTRKSVAQVKLEELSDEKRDDLEKRLQDVIELAEPLSKLLTDVTTAQILRRIGAEGVPAEIAQKLLHLIPGLHREIKMLKSAKF